MSSEEDILQLADSLDLQNKDLVFLPINDNDCDQVGGTHWSLLVYFRIPILKSEKHQNSNTHTHENTKSQNHNTTQNHTINNSNPSSHTSSNNSNSNSPPPLAHQRKRKNSDSSNAASETNIPESITTASSTPPNPKKLHTSRSSSSESSLIHCPSHTHTGSTINNSSITKNTTQLDENKNNLKVSIKLNKINRSGHFIHFDSLDKESNSNNLQSAKTVAHRLSYCTALPARPLTKSMCEGLSRYGQSMSSNSNLDSNDNDSDSHLNSGKISASDHLSTRSSRAFDQSGNSINFSNTTENSRRRPKRETRKNKQNSSSIVSEDDNFPKQTNTYDCGLYVILAVTILAESYRNPNCGFTTSEINPTAINSLRQQLRTTIEGLYKNHLIENTATYITNGNNCISEGEMKIGRNGIC